MAVHTLSFDAGFSRQSSASSLNVGDASSTVSEVRYVINAATTRDAAIDLANESAANSVLYGSLSLGGSRTLYLPNDGTIWNNIHRIDFLCIGSVEVYTSSSLDNFGNPVTDPTTYQKALRCMHTVKYPFQNNKKSVTIGVSA